MTVAIHKIHIQVKQNIANHTVTLRSKSNSDLIRSKLDYITIKPNGLHQIWTMRSTQVCKPRLLEQLKFSWESRHLTAKKSWIQIQAIRYFCMEFACSLCSCALSLDALPSSKNIKQHIHTVSKNQLQKMLLVAFLKIHRQFKQE